MPKIFILLTSSLLLVGCVESMALLGPASSIVGGGNVVQSTVSSAINYGVKKKTGKSPMQHALSYAEKKNPNKEKKRCISFIEKTNSEACMIVNKQIASTKAAVVKKITSTQNFVKGKSQVGLEKTFEDKNKTKYLIKPKKSAKEFVSLVRAKIKKFDDRWLIRIQNSQKKNSKFSVLGLSRLDLDLHSQICNSNFCRIFYNVP